MFSCDYNGWTDMPEAEREGLEAFELAQEPLTARVLTREHTVSRSVLPERFPV